MCLISLATEQSWSVVPCANMSWPLDNECDNDWTERFISVVQGKPALYDRQMKEHSDRNIVTRLWTEVCEVMIPLWQDMTPKEKSFKSKEIQQRWRNLRTCFKRELNKQKNSSFGPPTKKRRKYIYFDQLLFLLPTIEDRDNTGETSSPRMEPEYSEENDDREVDDTNSYAHYYPAQRHVAAAHTDTKPEDLVTSYEDTLLTILKEKTEEIDEDKTFLLSLVPSFRKMNDDQKLEVKIEFLSIIRRIKQSKPNFSCNDTT